MFHWNLVYNKYNFNYKYLVNYEKNLQFDIEINIKDFSFEFIYHIVNIFFL